MNEITRLAIQETINGLIYDINEKPMETYLFIIRAIGKDGRDDLNIYPDNAGIYLGLCNLVCQIIKQKRNMIVLPVQVSEYLESNKG